MTNRRAFLHMAVATSALPAVMRFSVAHAQASSCGEYLYKAVFDERFASCVDFARRVGHFGVPVHGIHGDVTALWYRDLSKQWRATPTPIAGLTAAWPLLCLEQMARDHGLRVVYRAEHNYRSDSLLEHRLTGPANVVQPDWRAGAIPWPERVATLVANFPLQREAAVKSAANEVTNRPATDPQRLVSWIIAPAQRG